jgi:murein DD-endopeptidase MepM/ murein hydrolase activator NlpD
MSKDEKSFINRKVGEQLQLEKIIKEAISFGSARQGTSGASGALEAQYDGPLVTVQGGKRWLGDPKTGISPKGFWKNFRERFPKHINTVYPELGLTVRDLGVSRDLSKAADPGGNTARVAGSKHGAGLAQDLYLDTTKYGKYTSIGAMNPKLAVDQKFVDAIISFMALPANIDLRWGGAFGHPGTSSLSPGQAPKGRGITEFHHFEYRGPAIPGQFKPHDEELKKLKMSSADMTKTSTLGKLYNALAEGRITKATVKYLLEDVSFGKDSSGEKTSVKKAEDTNTKFSVDIPEGTEFVHPLPIYKGKNWGAKEPTSLPQASRNVSGATFASGKARPHKGADFGAAVGTPLLAYTAGTVTAVKNQPKGAGYFVSVVHSISATDGDASGALTTQYMHMSRQDVKVGDKVTAGHVVGLSGGAPGATGSGNTTAPHLHFTFKVGKTQSYNGDLYRDLLAKATVVTVADLDPTSKTPTEKKVSEVLKRIIKQMIKS